MRSDVNLEAEKKLERGENSQEGNKKEARNSKTYRAGLNTNENSHRQTFDLN